MRGENVISIKVVIGSWIKYGVSSHKGSFTEADSSRSFLTFNFCFVVSNLARPFPEITFLYPGLGPHPKNLFFEWEYTVILSLSY